jgi:hypothetical protein
MSVEQLILRDTAIKIIYFVKIERKKTFRFQGDMITHVLQTTKFIIGKT